MPFNLIKLRVDAVGLYQRFKVQGLVVKVGVDKLLGTPGLATGQPPHKGWRYIDMDAADKRLRLRKSTYFRRYVRRFLETRQLAALQR